MTEIKLDDWLAWRRKQYQHDKVGNLLRCQICGANLRNVEQLPQVPLKHLAGGSPMKSGNLGGVAVKRNSGKATLYQQLCKSLKLGFGFLLGHKSAKWPNAPHEPCGTGDSKQSGA